MRAVTVSEKYKPLLLAWAANQWQPDGTKWHPGMTSCLAIVDRTGTLRGAAIFTEYSGHDIHLTGVGRYVFSRSVCRAVCDYVFNQLRCDRMTVIIRASRLELQNVCERHGFRVEGVIRRRYGDEDGVLMGMLRADCRWLERKYADGRSTTRPDAAGPDTGGTGPDSIEPRNRDYPSPA